MRIQTATILAAVSVVGGVAIILAGRGGISTDMADATAPAARESVTLASPQPPAKPLSASPARLSRLVAPQIVAPPHIDAGELQREPPRGPLSKLSLALPPPPRPPGRWNGTSFFRPVATESAVFESMDRTVTIAGTGSLAPEETCLTDGVSWPCGARARAAFRLWLRGRALVCRLPPGADAVSIVAACRLGKQDAGAWLVSNGWARAAPDGPYVEAEAKARAAGMGIFGPPPDTSSLSAVPAAALPSAPDQPILVE